MSGIDYGAAPVPVRQDLVAAHRRAWRRLARAGCWWRGSERLAIAAEVRNAPACPLCRERKAALSPGAVAGRHASLDVLPEAAVEAVHRITTDPGRLSSAWFQQTLASGLSDGQYVELVGVVVTLVSIDSFCRGLGVALHPLPAPEPGEPERRRPPGLATGVAWVPMLEPRRAAPEDRDLFPGPRAPNVLRALSLVPDEVRTLMDLSGAHYLGPLEIVDPSRSRGVLDRAQVELVAARVSALRECFY